ncbi:hypothetical protein SCHIN_v1c06000 [Spiroplasma chinense]|uniref:Lipoprotein n=1 Tax=Spiroplasma chinense TaxID=216932 RepID=A0A5B9Y6B7_9MOLU|nr:lipoprotein [Spiroplasma chinense]QEH61797.1 hypothetical protein SCHIN_v1c06000 [Spiroplasma chinense]
MKKLLAFIGGISVTTPTAISVVSCDPGEATVFAPANSDISELLTNYKQVIINQKNKETLIKSIVDLKVMSADQFLLEDNIDFTSDKGVVKITGNKDYFLPVIGETEIEWIYKDSSNPNEENGSETPKPDEENSLNNIEKELNTSAGFKIDLKSQMKSAEEGFKDAPAGITSIEEYTWYLIGAQVEATFSTVTKKAFGIDENDYDSVRKDLTYTNDWKEVIKDKKLEEQTLLVRHWGLEGSWIKGQAIIEVEII